MTRLCCERSHLLIRDSVITLLFVIPILGLAGLFSAEDLRYHIFFFLRKNFFPLGLASVRSNPGDRPDQPSLMSLEIEGQVPTSAGLFLVHFYHLLEGIG
jgi:hypothetical protein